MILRLFLCQIFDTDIKIKYILALGQATYFSAICVNIINLPKIQIHIKETVSGSNLEDEIEMVIEGTTTQITNIPLNANATVALDGVAETLQFKRTEKNVTVLFSTGISITVSADNVSLNNPTSTST